jgi:hypothetical protein
MHRKLAVVFAVLAVIAGACGTGDTKVKGASANATTTTRCGFFCQRRTTTTQKVTTTTAAGGTTTTKVPKTTTTTSTKPPKTTTTTAANPNPAPGPAAPGTYDYAQSGSTSDGAPPSRGTLVVSGSGPSQIFHRYVDPSGQPSDLYFTFRSDGPYLTKVVLRQKGITLTCTFGSPVPAPPWPPTTGRSFSGHATCDNNMSADFSGSITGQGSDSVGGKAYDVVVVASTLHATGQIFGQPVDVTVKDTQHWAPALRVPTYSHEVISGNASGDVTSTLLNASPH